MATNSSAKFDFITSKSLVRSGSPTVYQLNPEKKETGSLTRLTLGEPDLNQINKTILLVGETGVGKSTLVNALVNYILGVSWEDEVWFDIVGHDCDGSLVQTSDLVLYQIFGFEEKPLPYSLTIIDTPGYGNTSGTEEDDVNSQRLLDLFRSEGGVSEINVVGLVLKATANRVSDRMRYIFDAVVSLFGKDMENSIVPLITHSDGRTPKNVLKALQTTNIRCANDGNNQPDYFLFNNCQDEERLEDTEALERADKTTSGALSKFWDFLQEKEPQRLELTVEVLQERTALKDCIQNLKERAEATEQQQKEIQQTEEDLKRHEKEMKINKDFTEEEEEVYKEKESLSGWILWLLWFKWPVSCPACEETCNMSWIFYLWALLTRGHCSACPGKCPVSHHVKKCWRYVSKTRTVQKTLHEVKEKHDKAKADAEKTKNCLESLQEKKEELQRDRDQLLEESYQHVLTLERIALNVDSLSTHVHLDFLTEKMKERGDAEKVQKLEELKAREDEGIRAGLHYKLTSGSVKLRS
ncbi:septin-1-like [Cheilinus undulatus]|uniref:septin-1-like n=1 Tax=Cheilinus undulatus TaxID=241271 RepID=UPI001BD60690|nr:septin-1-like [Cheilinus undulatus]